MPYDYYDDDWLDEDEYGYYARKKVTNPSFMDYDVEGEVYEDDYDWIGTDDSDGYFSNSEDYPWEF